MKISVFGILTLASASLFVTSLAARAQTQDEATVRRLAEVIVTATRRETPAFETPYATHALDLATQASERAFRSLPSALDSVPGVMTQKTAFGQESPFIRGFTGFRTLLLVDGIRVNNSVFRDGPNQYWGLVDPLALARLELVKGPSSVVYGSDAIGGTANGLTRAPELRAESAWSRRAYYRFSSAEESHIGRGEISANVGDQFGFIGGASYKTFGDLRAGGDTGQLSHTGYDELDSDAKFVFAPREHLRVTLAWQHAEQEAVPRWHSTVFSKSFAGTTLGTDLQRDTDENRDFAYARLDADDLGGAVERAQFTVSYQRHGETEFRVPANGRLQIQGFRVDTLGVGAQFESPATRLGTWTFGADYYRDWVDSHGARQLVAGGPLVPQPRGTVADDASYDLVGAFAQDELNVGEKWTVTAGGRYTFARAEAGVVDPDPAALPNVGPLADDWNSVVGSGRALFRATEHWHLFAGISQGFRAPNLSDLTRFDTARSGELETPSPNLKPEQFISYEVGVKTQHERVNGYAAYFYTDISDMIVRFPTGALINGQPEVTRANSGRGFVHGVELAGEWRVGGGWSLWGDVTWMEGELETPVSPGVSATAPLSRVQPATAHLGGRWRAPQKRWWIETAVTLAARADKLSFEDQRDTQRIPPGGTPGYAVWHVRGGWRVREGVDVFAGIENILDKDYRVHGSGINEPGRNAIVGAEVKF
jgi:hemoglobin/transferrin/lactoferrin receptor protein